MKKKRKPKYKPVKNTGEIIRARREAIGMSRPYLAVKVFPGMSQVSAESKMRRIELGQIPKVHEITKIAEVLEMTPEDITDAEVKLDRVRSGFTVSGKTLQRFPNLENILSVLNNAVEMEDNDLINMALKRLRVLKAKKLD